VKSTILSLSVARKISGSPSFPAPLKGLAVFLEKVTACAKCGFLDEASEAAPSKCASVADKVDAENVEVVIHLLKTLGHPPSYGLAKFCDLDLAIAWPNK
jgi:hypothetical protein